MTYMRGPQLFGFGHGYIGGLSNLGDDLIIDWSHQDSAVLALQRELQRLGFLPTGTGTFGADGKWGPRTETAMTMAAQYIEWSGPPFTAHYDNAQHNRGSVNVPAELIARLRAAAPAPGGTAGRVGVPPPVEPEEPRITIGPHLDPPEGYSFDHEQPLPWWPWVLIGGGVLMMGGAAMWMMRKPTRTAPPRFSRASTVHANRRRFRRRSRR